MNSFRTRSIAAKVLKLHSHTLMMTLLNHDRETRVQVLEIIHLQLKL